MARSPLDDVLELGVRGLGGIGKVGLTCAGDCPRPKQGRFIPHRRPLCGVTAVLFSTQNHGRENRKLELQPVFPLHRASAGASVVSWGGLEGGTDGNGVVKAKCNSTAPGHQSRSGCRRRRVCSYICSNIRSMARSVFSTCWLQCIVHGDRCCAENCNTLVCAILLRNSPCNYVNFNPQL